MNKANKRLSSVFHKWQTACAYIVIGLCCHAHAIEIVPGQLFESPNGKFTVESQGADDGVITALRLIENNTHKCRASADVVDLYALQWTGDSRAAVFITHIAGGTVAKVFVFTDSQWHIYSADPREGESYSVVQLVTRLHNPDLVYAVKDKVTNSQSFKFYTYGFTFDCQTTRHLKIKRSPITSSAYEAMIQAFENKGKQ